MQSGSTNFSFLNLSVVPTLLSCTLSCSISILVCFQSDSSAEASFFLCNKVNSHGQALIKVIYIVYETLFIQCLCWYNIMMSCTKQPTIFTTGKD